LLSAFATTSLADWDGVWQLRSRSGNVPNVNWNGTKLHVNADWYDARNANPNFRVRSEVVPKRA